MSDRRVVVTGVGAITALGPSLTETIAALKSPRSPIGPATLFDASGFSCRWAAEIRDWDARPSFRAPKALKLTDRPARFAVAAARMALADAAWCPEPSANDRLGVAIGTSGSDLQARDLARALGGDPTGECVTHVPTFAERMMSGLNPLWLLISLPNMVSAHVAIQVEARGPNTTVMSDWAAGSQAIGEASEWIRCGEADAVLAGGTDCGVQPFAYQAYERAGWLHTGEDGTGFIPGEGSAVFLLEERGAALARGAPIRAEILAYASRTPHHQRSAAQTLAQTLCEAMTRAGWNRHNVSACTIAAPTTPLFANVSRGAIAVAVDDRSARATCDERFGFSLAAAAPIDAAVTMCTAPGGARVLSSAVGSSHEAVTLAFEVAG